MTTNEEAKIQSGIAFAKGGGANAGEHPVIGAFRARLNEAFGYEVRAGSAEARRAFGGLPEAARAAFLGAIRESGAALDAFPSTREGRPSEKALFSRALSKLGLLADSQVLEEIEEDDVVEVFDTGLRQIYRSYNCYGVCNYSLEELAVYPFYELYGRHSSISAKLMEACEAVASGKVKYWSFADLPEYHIQELRLDPPESFAMREKFGARLRSTLNGETYLLSVKKVRPLGVGGSSLRYL
jgi:hypothetical protein